MAVTIMCPNLRCRKILIVPNSVRGTRVRCAYCKTMMAVPWAKSPAEVAGQNKDDATKSKTK